jgi:CDP-diacylglycerol--glycerol-3-phosphate 3-phosphatidyltransferase
MSTPNTIDPLSFDTVPNRLTVLRMLCVPAVVYCMAQGTVNYDIAAAVLFSIAAITDYFDGAIARSYKTETIFGKLMDPLADKFLVLGALIMLQQANRINYLLVMILIFREMAITSLRALASAEGVIIAAGTGGKWKAALQMVAIPFLIIHQTIFGFVNCRAVGMILLVISVGLSLTSAASYAWDFYKELLQRKLKRQS